MEAYVREEFDEIRRLMREEEEARKQSRMEFDERLKKEAEAREQSSEAFDARLKKEAEAREQSRIEFDERLKKEAEVRERKSAEFDEQIKKANRLIGNYGQNQGDIAEDFFFRTLEQKKCLGTIEFDEIARNLHSRYQGKEGEYDVVLYNGDCLGVVEVKSKPHPEGIEKFVTVDLPKFKTIFPQFEPYRIYAAIAGMAVLPEVQKCAESEGLFVLTQAQNHLICANSKGFQAKAF